MKPIKTDVVSITKSLVLSAVFIAGLFCFLSADFVKAQKQRATTEISGTVLGGNGKPLQKAFVALSDGSYLKTLAVAEADQNGNFRLTTNKTGLFLLHFNGVNHLTETIVLMVEKPRKITVNAKLFVPEYKEDLSEAFVSSEKVRGVAGTNFTKQQDDTYAAEFETKEKTLDYVIGKALKIRGAIQGTDEGNYKLHESGTLIFKEAIPVNGKVRIVLDPAKLPQPSDAGEISFGNPESADAKLYAIYREMESRKPPQSQQTAANPTSEEINKLVYRINNEKNLSLRKALWLNYLHLTLPANKTDAAMASKALDTISPTSPLWILHPELVDKAVTTANQPAKYKEYLNGVVNRLPSDIKVFAIGTCFFDAFKDKQMEKAQTYLGRLVKEFPDNPMTKFARSTMDKDKKVAIGKPVPAFAAHSFDDPNVLYTNTNIKAKVYLIDFWATWCGPCIGQMPYLHRAYERFRGKGFEILSYSLDSNREVVTNFRKRKQTPMTWLHAIDPQLREMNDEIAKQFELIGIPVAVLVDSNGKILATHLDLEGDKLEKMLAGILGEPESVKW